MILHRVPVNGTVAVEDARSLSTGDRLPTSGYVFSDVLGSVVATAPLNGGETVGAATAYDAWGQQLALATSGGPPAPSHGFVGDERDRIFGTYSFGVRVYDPSVDSLQRDAEHLGKLRDPRGPTASTPAAEHRGPLAGARCG